MRQVILIASLAALAAPALGQAHLVPSPSPYAELRDTYNADEARVIPRLFHYVYGTDVAARLIAFPNMAQEYAVAILAHGGQYSVRVLRQEAMPAHRHRPYATRRLRLADLLDAVRVVKSDCALPPMLGGRLADAWRKAVFRTHYDPVPKGTVVVTGDGDTYDFSTRGESGQISGTVWSPPPDSEAGLLVATADLLRDYCPGADPKALAELDAKTAALEQAMP